MEELILFYLETLPNRKKLIQLKILKLNLGKMAQGNGKKGKRKERLENYVLLIQNNWGLDITSVFHILCEFISNMGIVHLVDKIFEIQYTVHKTLVHLMGHKIT